MNQPLAAIGLTCLATCGGCAAAGSVETSIRIKDANQAEDAAIRKQEYRVMKAVQDVVVTYGLQELDIDVVIEEEGGLGETKPEFNLWLHVDGATVSINKILFLEDNPHTDDILLGLFAHELGHGLHYSVLSELDLILLGERYERFYLNPEGHLKPWAEAYEQFTDLTAIVHGYGKPLIQQKIRSQDNVSKNHPAKVWSFYLKPDEIEALMNDRAALQRKIDETLGVIDLASLTRFGKGLPIEQVPVADSADPSH